MLGTDLRSSAKAIYTLNHCVVQASPGLPALFPSCWDDSHVPPCSAHFIIVCMCMYNVKGYRAHVPQLCGSQEQLSGVSSLLLLLTVLAVKLDHQACIRSFTN